MLGCFIMSRQWEKHGCLRIFDFLSFPFPHFNLKTLNVTDHLLVTWLIFQQWLCHILLHPLRMNRIHRTQFDHERLDHECFDYLSRETYAKHSVGTKAFWPPIVVARTPSPLFTSFIWAGKVPVGVVTVCSLHRYPLSVYPFWHVECGGHKFPKQAFWRYNNSIQEYITCTESQVLRKEVDSTKNGILKTDQAFSDNCYAYYLFWNTLNVFFLLMYTKWIKKY